LVLSEPPLDSARLSFHISPKPPATVDHVPILAAYTRYDQPVFDEPVIDDHDVVVTVQVTVN